MSTAQAEPLRIGIATAGERREALALVFRNVVTEAELPHVDQLLVSPGCEEPWKGLYVARRGGRVVGAVFSQLQPGNVALVWFPQITADESAATAGQLLTTAAEELAQQGVSMAQCSLGKPTPADDALLKQAGFQWLASLFYLVSSEPDFPKSAPASRLKFERYGPATEERLKRIIEATYQGTLDCPALNGIRTIDDVLAGYRASGVFDPGRWLTFTDGQRDVGCLVLTDYPDQENWELIYMGVVPEGRGHGWGKDIARQAQWMAYQAGRRRIVLAVDAANQPAIRMYAEVGFRVWDRRSVYWKILAGDRPSPEAR
jgi:GNAT superfamily N-acetyltransferase